MNRFLALAVAAAVLLAGCGGDDGGDAAADPLAALATALEKTAHTESYRAKVSMRSDVEGAELAFSGVGTFTADSTRGRFEGRIAVGNGWTGFEALLLGPVSYVRGEQIPMPAGKEWIEVREPPTSSLSPSEFTALLRDSEGVRNLGTETIRGERTTHFRGPLDPKKVAAKSAPDLVERLRRLRAAEGLECLIDIWVAQDGLPSRVDADISMPGVAGNVEATSDILEYDVEVDVEKPPSNTVASE